MLVGAAIGSKIHNFWIIFILGILSHFILDRLPHWEYGRHIKFTNLTHKEFTIFSLKAFLDLGLGTFFIACFFYGTPDYWYALWGALAGILPDGLLFLFIFLLVLFDQKINWLEKYYNFHKKNHSPENKNSLAQGIIVEGLAVILSLLIFFI